MPQALDPSLLALREQAGGAPLWHSRLVWLFLFFFSLGRPIFPVIILDVAVLLFLAHRLLPWSAPVMLFLVDRLLSWSAFVPIVTSVFWLNAAFNVPIDVLGPS